MRIVKKNNFKIPENSLKTSITNVEPDNLITRGYLQEDLIENLSFSDMIFLLLKGKLPTEKESKIFAHVLVSFCDHGVTPPSTQAARIIASSGSPINNAVAGGLLSFGKNHAGAIKKSMDLFQSKLKDFDDKDANVDENKVIVEIALSIYDEFDSKGLKVPGFGHRYHTKDPRAVKLMELVINEGMIGPHTKLAIVLDNLLYDKKGIHINVDGINAGILSDLGFDSTLGLGVFIISRVPGLVAHSYEEIVNEENFRKFFDLDDIEYDGKNFVNY